MFVSVPQRSRPGGAHQQATHAAGGLQHESSGRSQHVRHLVRGSQTVRARPHGHHVGIGAAHCAIPAPFWHHECTQNKIIGPAVVMRIILNCSCLMCVLTF